MKDDATANRNGFDNGLTLVAIYNGARTERDVGQGRRKTGLFNGMVIRLNDGTVSASTWFA